MPSPKRSSNVNRRWWAVTVAATRFGAARTKPSRGSRRYVLDDHLEPMMGGENPLEDGNKSLLALEQGGRRLLGVHAKRDPRLLHGREGVDGLGGVGEPVGRVGGRAGGVVLSGDRPRLCAVSDGFGAHARQKFKGHDGSEAVSHGPLDLDAVCRDRGARGDGRKSVGHYQGAPKRKRVATGVGSHSGPAPEVGVEIVGRGDNEAVARETFSQNGVPGGKCRRGSASKRIRPWLCRESCRGLARLRPSTRQSERGPFEKRSIPKMVPSLALNS
jgi:hypothetical protein